MIATTTDLVREPVREGDTVVNSRAERFTVTRAAGGEGLTGVLLTERPGLNRSTVHVVWVVSAEGRVRATMTTSDEAAAAGAFAARADGMNETGVRA